jgi:TonB family protein
MSGTEASVFYPAPGLLLRPRAGTVLLALALSTATFLVLPLFGILSVRRDESLRLRHAPAVIPAPARTSYVRPPQVDIARPPRRPRLHKPRLERPAQQIDALRAQISLSMGSLSAGVGDFALNFRIDPMRGLRDEYGKPLMSLTDLDGLPRPLVRVRPVYPHHARQKGIEGIVELAFVITPEGRVEHPRVLRSEPPGTFDAAARAAVLRWRFTAPMKDGSPVAALARQSIRFELEH